MRELSLHLEQLIGIIMTSGPSHHEDPEVIYAPHSTDVGIPDRIAELEENEGVAHVKDAVRKDFVPCVHYRAKQYVTQSGRAIS